jgi:hypothetical protein
LQANAPRQETFEMWFQAPLITWGILYRFL